MLSKVHRSLHRGASEGRQEARAISKQPEIQGATLEAPNAFCSS